MWNGINEQGVQPEATPAARQAVAAGTLQSSMSRGERPNARHNASRPVASHLGPFRRELLLHLAIREAVTRNKHGRQAVPATGLRWTPSGALTANVELTRTLTVKISNALSALEDLGYIRRQREAGPRGKTTHIKVTPAGAREAVEIAFRQNLAKSTAARKRQRYTDYIAKQNPVEWAEWLLGDVKEYLVTSGRESDPAMTVNPAPRRALRHLRAHVKADPADTRAKALLQELEVHIPPYRPTLADLDIFLGGVAESAFHAISASFSDPIDPDESWIASVKTFDLVAGWTPSA